MIWLLVRLKRVMDTRSSMPRRVGRGTNCIPVQPSWDSRRSDAERRPSGRLLFSFSYEETQNSLAWLFGNDVHQSTWHIDQFAHCLAADVAFHVLFVQCGLFGGLLCDVGWNM